MRPREGYTTKFYLISDNHDTLTGLRLAGIEGKVVSTEKELEETLKTVCDDEQVGIILVTQNLAALCPSLIYDVKMHRQRPLIAEIPDRHGSRDKDTILRYVREAIGVKI